MSVTELPAHREPLAIVGIGCRFPGDADTANSFWRLLRDEVDATGDVPATRWNAQRYHDPNPAKMGKVVTRRGGFLSEIDQFDPQFFGISPREAHSLDPQQRLLLEVTWEAFEDGGIPVDQVAGTDVGVFIGGFTLDYQLIQNQGRTSRYRFKPHSATGMMMTMLANRLSHAFDFRGPSMTVDTACSSSLVATHLAAQSIWNGECELAVAGGVNIMVGPNTAIAESRSGFLSPQGRSRAFDDAADGYARGEGGAVVIIKPLQQALRDGDDIYAQILGTAVSQDGHTDGITVPREDAQRLAIKAALERAELDPDQIGYVEAHGTGTPVGDPIEMRALAQALTTDRPASRPLLIGSVKTNIGHLEAGAGVAGLIKAAMVVKHGFIPANLHLQKPTSHVSLAELKLDIPPTGRPFPPAARRIAGVNSFGFGGTNAHVVLAEPPAPMTTPAAVNPLPLAAIPISARSAEALVATAGRLADHLEEHPDIALPDLGYTLARRRTHLSHRHTVIGEDLGEVREQLRALADGGAIEADRIGSSTAKLAFVCTGMGPQWWRMCRGLLDVAPAFTESIRRTDRELSRYADWSLIEELCRNESDSRMANTEIAQPANFAIQVALAAQLAEFGIVPDAVIGHSAGEVAAHHLAGLLSFEQAVRVIYHRSRLQQRTSGQGRMLAVALDAETLMKTIDQKIADEFGRRVSIAAINSPSAVTVAGDGDVLEDIARQLDEAQIFNRYLAVQVPYHTHYMDAVRADLLDSLAGLSADPARLPLYSTVTGELLDGYDAGAAYWWQNTRATVLFEPALRRMLDDGYTHFVELGPHPVLAASILETAGAQRVSVMSAQRREHDDLRTLLTCLGALHNAGHEVAWDRVYPGNRVQVAGLPHYPWQTKRYWYDNYEVDEALFYTPVHPLLGQPVRGVHPTWEVEISTAAHGFLEGHRIQGSVVVPGAVYVEMAMAAARQTYGSEHSVENLVLHRAVLLDDRCDPIIRTTLNQDDGTVEFASFTATGDGDLKWAITATAELGTCPTVAHARPAGTGPSSSMDGDRFYQGTQAIGFDYGGAFRSVTAVRAGHDWATAQLRVPAEIADELGDYRFHPALIDGAFQTLFGAPFSGQEENEDPYLPTRIRRCAVYGPPTPSMTVQVHVVSATRDAVECDITVTDEHDQVLAVFDGFTVQSLSSSSRMSVDHIDKGLYELHWSPADDTGEPALIAADEACWLVLADGAGVGERVADALRSHGRRVLMLRREPEGIDWATILDEQAADLGGIIDCWPMDMTDGSPDNLDAGPFNILRLVKALADRPTIKPKIFLVTANAQATPGTAVASLDQASIWGLGRVIGHQEFPDIWGGLIDIDSADDGAMIATRICEHVLGGAAEDQIAIRGTTTLVPRLRLCGGLTKPFPMKLSADATYVVTGGAGALGRVVAGFLAERGARHITLIGRTALPPRDEWSELSEDHPQIKAVNAFRLIERLGAQIETVSADITDADEMSRWLAGHLRGGGRPVRGIVHAAGSVNDQLVVNMGEDDYARVLAPKMAGTRVLHDVFAGHELDFFVLFGSAGSTIAAPGQANYAAANAFLDAFAHHRQAQGLPALTIGWGPWSVGMVEELKLEKIYAQRGIELITPAVGARILGRLISQRIPNVVAISADWDRARQAGMGGRLPAMFAELESAGSAVSAEGADSSILDVLAETPEAQRRSLIAEQVQRVVADVFDCGIADIRPDDMLDDIGLDSMMAMDFRVRINAVFSIDVPVLEILRGVSVNSLSDRILDELHAIHGAVPVAETDVAETDVTETDVTEGADVDDLLADLSDEELRTLLAELEADGEMSDGEATAP
ncbi:type I polyketide synthase [Mycolicibacterium neoaurum]|uniref:Mycocerosic acid synthase n=1 Tax=Mycolicibacterium neoaurum TaxID=1795 RepID=A0AAV2WLC8_MYCNE|nr:type I polyketide synthase [Mycolicibacterium neoaurum]TLH48770.1 KR domain-containing protein [Mycolicibacterium neoaurum]CDQ45034.1 mycocerosic acid synthase [Mycolicibacterium neoaurum]